MIKHGIKVLIKGSILKKQNLARQNWVITTKYVNDEGNEEHHNIGISSVLISDLVIIDAQKDDSKNEQKQIKWEYNFLKHVSWTMKVFLLCK